MKQIKENAIANQKKIIAELRENTSCESSREKAIEKLNLIVDDYEKDNNTIEKDNIHLYYEFMDNESVCEFGRNNSLLYRTHDNRHLQIIDLLNIDIKILDKYKKTCIHAYYFGVKDNLKPIDEYIAEIKNSNEYKEYRFNNLVKTYDLSISHLKQLEHELFADDSTYISNIENLIYSALDKIADDFKLNVIDYIEDNCLQESTGLSCISDIEVIIKDGEYQGIFKEFESYGLNNFSVQNITMFIDRYKELKESVEYKSYIVNDKSDFESDEYENICFENKMMGQFLEKLGLTPDEITSYVINGSEEDINNMITRVKGL